MTKSSSLIGAFREEGCTMQQQQQSKQASQLVLTQTWVRASWPSCYFAAAAALCIPLRWKSLAHFLDQLAALSLRSYKYQGCQVILISMGRDIERQSGKSREGTKLPIKIV